MPGQPDPPAPQQDPAPVVGGPPVTPPPAFPPVPLSPEAIQGTPEFIALAEQNRELARKVGTFEAAERIRRETAAREAAEATSRRAAAEAQERAAQLAEVQRELGAQGVALWNEISTLSATDPVGAARKVRELGILMAQSQAPAPAGTGTSMQAPPPVTGGTVSTQTPPPPPSRGAGDTPLGQSVAGEDFEQIATAAEAKFQSIAKRTQDPETRNRVSMRDRADGMMSFLAAGYLRGGARPKS